VVNGTVTYDVLSRTATFTPKAALAPSSVYSVRLAGGLSNPHITDAAGNPLAADVTWTFTTRSLPTTFVDTSAADFNGGTLDAGVYVGAAGDGEVMLKPAAGAELDGVALPASWTMSPWAGTSSAAVSGGVMSVDGALVSTTALFLPGRSLEFTATFSGAPYQHAGFAVTFGVPLASCVVVR
jgi:hypothetical protein